MQKQDIETILASQRKFFATGKTLPVSWRLEQLKKLRTSMLRHEEDLYGALKKDLGKSRMESYMCEIGLTLSELTWMEKHIGRLTREKRVPTPLAQFAARSFQSPTPYGTVLIMSPWNYPVLLTLEPLIDALAAGNTVIVKPSAYAPATSAVMEMIIKETYPPEYVRMITGGRQENQALLTQRFDKIFFTGGKTVGREVLRHAAEYLTPVTLELGGKSPCIVDSTAKIPLAARRIVFGKYLNCGQTCVAPDYILCDVSIKDALLAAIQKEITRQFGDRPLDNPDYGKIINEKHFERILGLITKEKIICGGESDSSTLRIAPTVLTDVSWDDPVMGEEIFGPLLPVLTYSSLDEAIRTVESHPIHWHYISSAKTKKRRKKYWICVTSAAAASTTPLSILLPVPCHLAVSVRAVWVDTTAWKASKPSVTLAALSTKKPGWIFRSGIRSMWDGKKNFYGCFCDSFLIFALPKLKSVKYQKVVCSLSHQTIEHTTFYLHKQRARACLKNILSCSF